MKDITEISDFNQPMSEFVDLTLSVAKQLGGDDFVLHRFQWVQFASQFVKAMVEASEK